MQRTPTKNAENAMLARDRTDFMLVCVVFRVRALHTTGWKSALNIGIGIGPIRPH